MSDPGEAIASAEQAEKAESHPSQEGAWRVRRWFRGGQPSTLGRAAIAASLPAAFGLLTLVAFWQLGPQSEPGVALLAAGMVFMASLIGTSAHLFIGALKHSVDEGLARREEAAEARNRVDVALRAVALLEDEPSEGRPSQRTSGAVLALASLGELDLAVHLVHELWPRGELGSAAAESVLVRCLKSDDRHLQEAAAVAILQNPAGLDGGGVSHWPFAGPGWETDLPTNVRRILAHAVCEWLIRSVEEFGQDAPLGAAAVLAKAMDDEDAFIRTAAGHVLSAFLTCSKEPNDVVFALGDEHVVVGVLRAKAGKAMASSNRTTSLLAQRVYDGFARHGDLGHPAHGV